jgi:RNA polymerase sigma-70 factor (ECF subfamily)
MLANEADVEDVTQDVLLQVVRKLDTFRGEADLTTWLHRITVNAALVHRRKRAPQLAREARIPLEDALERGSPAAACVRNGLARPDLRAIDRESRGLIEQAIAELPEKYRDVFVLADVQCLPNAEVGETLNLSLAAVKSRLHRARVMLRDALAPHFDPEGLGQRPAASRPAATI